MDHRYRHGGMRPDPKALVPFPNLGQALEMFVLLIMLQMLVGGERLGWQSIE